ncbi:MAG TPA: hypothetical protein DCE42_13655 [Myxococcales bacterium]|nr:hypothetical protein [Deltaproteobacteria bacterium]MBU54290.1 hypothetical protein [Deltaproteobacteria bacterium]HAA55802.1 hypothetical protein [Myxococcales bacterium]
MRIVGSWMQLRLALTLSLAVSLSTNMGCSRGECLPECPSGYLCQDGQCLRSVEGNLLSRACRSYCRRVQDCRKQKGISFDVTICEDQCPDDTNSVLATSDEFLLKKYECFTSATCDEINQYLDAEATVHLHTCVGCRTEDSCPKGFRCDSKTKTCFVSCSSDSQCRTEDNYFCRTGKCKL